MKLHIPLVILALLLAPAWAEEAVKETITLTSDKVASESFTETSAGNGMFYSDSNGVAFISAGSKENPYTIGSADDTHADQDGISLSEGGAASVSVGSFTGDSSLIIGNGTDAVHVTTENGLFVGGYGWHGTSGWRTNASLISNTRGTMEFAAHEGSIVVNKGSTLEVGTGLGTDFQTLAGAQLYIGHGAKGTVTVDGGELISHAFIGISTSSSISDDNSGLLEIKNGGTARIVASPEEMGMNGYSYGQLLVGSSNQGVGSIVVSGEGSSLVVESSSSLDEKGQQYYTFVSVGQGAGTEGELSVADGASLQLGTETGATVQVSIGEASGTGALNVSTGASADVAGTLIVGYSGTGEVNINTGASMTQDNGAVLVGYGSDGSGAVNVQAQSSLQAESVSIGTGGAAGALNIAETATMQVSGNVYLQDTLDDGRANAIVNAGKVEIGGYLALYDNASVQNSGVAEIMGDIYLQEDSVLNNSGAITLQGDLNLSGASSMVLEEGSALTLGKDSALTFSISDAEQAPLLLMEEGATLTMDKESTIRLYLSGEALEAFESGTSFTLIEGVSDAVSTASVQILDYQGNVITSSLNGGVDANGNFVVSIPEPATATLSLLALAALAVRRRRMF